MIYRIIPLFILPACFEFSPEYTTKQGTAVFIECDYNFSPPEQFDIEFELDFFITHAPEYMPVERSIVEYVVGRAGVVFHCKPIPCVYQSEGQWVKGTCAGTQLGTAIHIHLLDSVPLRDSALLHELTHALIQVNEHVMDYQHLYSEYWNGLANMLKFEG